MDINPENIKRWKKDFKSGKLTRVPREKSAEESDGVYFVKNWQMLKWNVIF